MNGIIRGFLVVFSLIALSVVAEDERRDFYAEPGNQPFASTAGQDGIENIDPFSGNIQLSYVDIRIPGRGGLDINITRTYNTPQENPT